MELADRTEREFTGRKSTISGFVTLGATESVSARILAGFMKEFSGQYPDVQFNLQNGMADNLLEGIDQGSVDLALVLEPVDTTKYEFLRLPQKERWGVLVNGSHPFAGRDSVNITELPDQPLMLPDRASSPQGDSELDGLRRASAQYSGKLQSVVQHGRFWWRRAWGIAVCLEGALSIHHSPELRFVPLVPERAIRGILIWKKNHVFNPATSLFIQMIYRYREMDRTGADRRKKGRRRCWQTPEKEVK